MLQEERRVVYVGKIPYDFTWHDLRRKLDCFGEIIDCTVHTKDHRFVTLSVSRCLQFTLFVCTTHCL